MRRESLKYIKSFIVDGQAEDITSAECDRDLRNRTEVIIYSSGVYGVNGCLMQDRSNGKFYAIVGRSSSLFYYL